MASGTSTLLLQEHFEAASEAFLPLLLASDGAAALKAFGATWLKDERPFARESLLKYIDDGCDRPGHRALVKTLFKFFEQRASDLDDEVMAHFLVALDRLPRRRVVRKRRWDPAARTMAEYGELANDASIPAVDHQRRIQQGAFAGKQPFRANRYELIRFSRRTRLYLKRRAFRYFRKIGRKAPERYRRAMLQALRLYEDAHLQKAAQFLDAWGLVHALYWASPVLARHPWRGVDVAAGQELSNLKPSPLFPKLWKGCRDELFDLLSEAPSRTVRVWAAEWLRIGYTPEELQGVPVARIRRLLGSPHEEAQLLGAELFKAASGLESLPITEWLELLQIENLEVVPLICEQVAKNVAPNRVTLAQCVELACLPVAPVAELGLQWVKSKPVRGAIDLGVLMQLGSARTALVRSQAAGWLCELLLTSNVAREEHLRELIDSPFEDIRTAALALFTKAARYNASLPLWSALSESPHDDARSTLVQHLRGLESELAPDALRRVWATTLLGVHRGGRAKQIVLNRVANRLANRPSEAPELLPLVAIALRSVRPAERRPALGAISMAAARTPSLRAAIGQKFPELVLHEGVPA